MKTVVSRQANDSANQASQSNTPEVQRSPGTEVAEAIETPDVQMQLQMATQYGHSIGSVPVQAQLVMGQPGDPYEQEADKLAAQAVATPVQQKPAATRETPDLQREAPPVAAAIPATEAAVPTEVVPKNATELASGNLAEPTEAIAQTAETGKSSNLEARIQQAMNSGGEAFPGFIQIMLTERLGMQNPEAIVVHNDASAHQLCAELKARAFTSRNHIFFASGQYNPNSREGQELIFHESVHTIQQGAIQTVKAIPEAGSAPAEKPESVDAETELKSVADQSVSDDAVAVQQKATEGMVQREVATLEAEPAQQAKDKNQEQQVREREDELAKNEENNAKQNAEAVVGEQNAVIEQCDKEAESKQAEAIQENAAAQKGSAPPAPELSPQGVAAPLSGSMMGMGNTDLDPEVIGEAMQGQGGDLLKELGWSGSGISEAFYMQALQQEAFIAAGGGSSMGMPSSELSLPGKKDHKFKDYPTPHWAGGEGANIGEKIIGKVLLGGVPAKAIAVFNTFGSLINETNAFGVMATLMDGFIKITEVVSAILGLITLALSVLAALLFAIGVPLLALFGAGKALIVAAKKIMLFVKKLVAINAKIALARLLVMRPISMVMRSLDIQYSAAMGASAEELQKKSGKIIGHAVGMVTDGLTVLVASKGFAKGTDAIVKGIKSKASGAFKSIKSFVSSKASSSGGAAKISGGMATEGQNIGKTIKNATGFKAEIKAKIKGNMGDVMSKKHAFKYWDGEGEASGSELAKEAVKKIITKGVVKGGAKVAKDDVKKAVFGDESKDDQSKDDQSKPPEKEPSNETKLTVPSPVTPPAQQNSSDNESAFADSSLEERLIDKEAQRKQQYEEAVAALPPIPYDAIARVDGAAGVVALSEVEQQELGALQQAAQGQIAERESSTQAIFEAQVNAAENQAVIEQNQFMLGVQVANAQAFQAEAQELGQRGTQGKGSLSSMGPMIKPMMPQIQNGADQAANRGVSDPSFSQSGEAVKMADAAPAQGDSAINLGSAGVQGAEKSAQKSHSLIEEGDTTIEQTQEFQAIANQRREENAEEIAELTSACEEAQATQLALEDEKTTAHDERSAALQETLAWATESRAIIQAYLAGNLPSAEEAQVKALLGEDEENQNPEEALMQFNELSAAVAAEMKAEDEAVAAK